MSSNFLLIRKQACAKRTHWFTALLATWILLPYAKTLSYTHSPANTTRNQWALIIIVFAINIHIVDGATLHSINHMILQNAAQIKILDCFTTYQQRQHLGGYDSEEEAENTSQYNTRDTSGNVRGDANLPTDNHLNVSKRIHSERKPRRRPVHKVVRPTRSGHTEEVGRNGDLGAGKKGN